MSRKSIRELEHALEQLEQRAGHNGSGRTLSGEQVSAIEDVLSDDVKAAVRELFAYRREASVTEGVPTESIAGHVGPRAILEHMREHGAGDRADRIEATLTDREGSA